MKSFLLFLCMFACGCDVPDCPDKEKYIGDMVCTDNGTTTTCEPRWYCP